MITTSENENTNPQEQDSNLHDRSHCLYVNSFEPICVGYRLSGLSHHPTAFPTRLLKALVLQYHADINSPRLLNGSQPIHSAASRGTIAHVQILLNASAELDATNNDGRTPLHWVRWDVVEFLLDRGAEFTDGAAAGAGPTRATAMESTAY